MLVEQDGYYLNAIGEILKVELRGDNIPEDESGNIYLLNGRYMASQSGEYDLIGYIPKELHYEILRMIKDYWEFKGELK